MKKFIKQISVILAILTAFSLCSCGSKSYDQQTKADTVIETSEGALSDSTDQAEVESESSTEETSEAFIDDQPSLLDTEVVYDDNPGLLHPIVKTYHEGGQDDKNVFIYTLDYPEVILPDDEQVAYPNLQTALLEDLNNYLFARAQEARETFPEYFNEDMYNSEYFEPMYIDIRANILRADENIFSVEIISNDYLGGAHPNHASEVFTYSTKEGKLITPADIFTGRDELMSVLKEKLLEYEEDGEVSYFDLDGYLSEYMFENSYMYNKVAFNMAVRNDGIMFIFNPYELAPYACGTISVLLPYDEYASIMKPGIEKIAQNYIIKESVFMENDIKTADGYISVEADYSDDYGHIEEIEIKTSKDEFEFDTYTYSADPYIIRKDGKTYIYVMENADDEEKFIQVFMVDNGVVTFSGTIKGHFYSENREEEIYPVMDLNCYARSDTEYAFCDPDKITLSDGKVYSMSVDGMPKE